MKNFAFFLTFVSSFYLKSQNPLDQVDFTEMIAASPNLSLFIEKVENVHALEQRTTVKLRK